MKSRVLFITYDGLSDPLGGSQIIPYLLGLQATGRAITILSFEKSIRYESDGARIREALAAAGVQWFPLRFTSKPRYLAKLWDLLRMHLVALWLTFRNRIQMVHCRSYQAAQVGLVLKLFFRVRLLFDMRGFWVDERVDAGIWLRDQFPGNWLYPLFKRVEKALIRGSDHVISLTNRALPHIKDLAGKVPLSISVIPCCADFDHFCPDQKGEPDVRSLLGIPSEAVVLCYVGSLGTWYMLREMIEFYGELKRRVPEMRFLLITRDWEEQHESLWAELGMGEQRNSLHIVSASRSEVPQFLRAANVAVSFIRPSFSKRASSPTKIAELLALGVPIFCNAGVGDVDSMVHALGAGMILPSLDSESYRQAADALPNVIAMGGSELRKRARASLSLDTAIRLYSEAYSKLEG